MRMPWISVPRFAHAVNNLNPRKVTSVLPRVSRDVYSPMTTPTKPHSTACGTLPFLLHNLMLGSVLCSLAICALSRYLSLPAIFPNLYLYIPRICKNVYFIPQIYKRCVIHNVILRGTNPSLSFASGSIMCTVREKSVRFTCVFYTFLQFSLLFYFSIFCEYIYIFFK